MTSTGPPLQTGFPDGGQVLSYFGGNVMPLPISVPSGQNQNSGLIAIQSWNALSLNFIAGVKSNWLIQVQFWGDAAATLTIETLLYLVPKGATLTDVIPILGPYVLIIATNEGATADTLLESLVFPRQSAGRNGGEWASFNGLVAAGTTRSVTLPLITTGTAIVTVGACPQGCAYFATWQDSGNNTDTIFNQNEIEANAFDVFEIALPPGLVSLSFNNTTATGQGCFMSIITKPK